MKHKKLLIYICMILFLTGCATGIYTGLIKSDDIYSGGEDFRTDFINTRRALFKTRINAYGKYFGGLLLVKRIDSRTIRGLFLTETGIKIFDLEITPDSNTTIYCMKGFNYNRDEMLNGIADDIRILFLTDHSDHYPEIFHDKEYRFIVYSIITDKTYLYYKNNETGHMDKIAVHPDSGKFKEINFMDYSENLPHRIAINYPNNNISVNLELLEQE